MSRSGADLALLLLAGFRTLADQGTVELARRGFSDIRPVHDFALHSILSGATSASELGRAMSTSKQAAAKTIAVLEDRGYVRRAADPTDGRRAHLEVTDLGLRMMREGEEIFDDLRTRWEGQVGAESIAAVEAALQRLVGSGVIDPGSTGWGSQPTEE